MTVHEYAASVGPRYRAGRRAEKGRILDEFCATTGMHRKAAERILTDRLLPATFEQRTAPEHR